MEEIVGSLVAFAFSAAFLLWRATLSPSNGPGFRTRHWSNKLERCKITTKSFL